MAHVVQMKRTGGPEVLEWVATNVPEPAAGEVRIRTTAVGLNYIDTYHRSDLYPLDLPAVPGSEATGIVEAVGEGVTRFAPGDRVGTFGPATGAYATERNVPVDQLVKLPDGVTDEQAAALMLKGCTAQFLIEDCAGVVPRQTVLVYAAAGGVGHILVGWLKAIGAHVIGVVGSAAKAEQTLANGADHVIRHDEEDIAARVRDLTNGDGVPVIFDGVGQATWQASLDSAARRGLIVSFGNAGGAVTDVSLATLAKHGSLFVTRPTLFDYVLSAEARQRSVDRVFAMLKKGAITAEIGQRFPLKKAVEAHRAIEAGKTSGSTILIP